MPNPHSLLLCSFGLRLVYKKNRTQRIFFFGKSFVVNVQLYGTFYSPVQQCGQCSAGVDMGKDLGIVTIVELTRLCTECVLVCTLRFWATLYTISDINTNHVPNSMSYGTMVYLG